MKPQCEKQSDCLRELARVMEQFGIKYPLDAINSEYIRYKLSDRHWQAFPEFSEPAYWEFAIAEVEGRLVFIGDKLYDWKGDAHTVPYLNDGTKMDLRKGCEWSWNKPKPKTVMVEMLVEDAQFLMREFVDVTNIYISCKKAFEELK